MNIINLFLRYFIFYWECSEWVLLTKNLIRVGKSAHTTHNAENIVVSGVNTDLGGAGGLNSGVRENELKSGIVDARHIAGARRLVLLRAKGERVNVDARVRSTRVVLPRLNLVEVGTLTL